MDEEGSEKLPTYNQIFACALRNVLTNEWVKAIYPWYTVTLLSAACGNCYDWTKNKRCFHGPSPCHFPEDEAKLYIPPSTEAFLCIAWDCCYHDVWVNQYNFKKDPANKGEKVPVPRAKNGEELRLQELIGTILMKLLCVLTTSNFKVFLGSTTYNKTCGIETPDTYKEWKYYANDLPAEEKTKLSKQKEVSRKKRQERGRAKKQKSDSSNSQSATV